MYSKPSAGLIRHKARENIRNRIRKSKEEQGGTSGESERKLAPIRGAQIAELFAPFAPEPMDTEDEPSVPDEVQRQRMEKRQGKKPVEQNEEEKDEEEEDDSDDATEDEQAGDAPKEGELSKSEIVYNLLMDHDFMGTRYPEDVTMEALGIRGDVEMIFDNMGLKQMMRMYAGGYKDETCQFLATLQLHSYDEDDMEDFDQGPGWITFLVNGKEYSLSYRALDNLFGFRSGVDTAVKYEDSELKALWKAIAQGHYSPSKSKSSQIRSPVLRYVHKALANTFFARTVTGHCTIGEIQLLDTGLMPIIKRLGGIEMLGDQSDTGLLGPFLDQLMSYQDSAYIHRDRKTKASLYVGGIITPILLACQVPVDETGYVQHGWVNIDYLKRAKILDHREVDGHYVYNFDRPRGGLAKILLPNRALTKFRNGRNVDFQPPQEALYQHGQRRAQQVPAPEPQPMEEDIQEDEGMAEPERYFFPEYPYQGEVPAVAAAHKRIGFLQKLNKWHIKKVDQLKQTVSSMAKSIKKLEKKVMRSSTKKATHPPFVRSRSLIHATRRPSTHEPHRSSSFEPREAHHQRQKKRRSSSSLRIDFTEELDRAHSDAPDQPPSGFTATLDRDQGEGSSRHVDYSSEFNRAAMVEYSAPGGMLPPQEREDILADLFGHH